MTSDSKRMPKETIKTTVSRLKANRQRPSINQHIDTSLAIEKTQGPTKTQRVSKNTTSALATNRTTILNQIAKRLLLGELTQGQALKELRINVLGLKQDVYANLVNISRKTLSDIENDRGNYKTDILNKAFKPFGLKVGLIPSSPSRLDSILSETLV